MEDVSKTKSGGLNLNSKKVDHKIVRVYEDEEYVLKKCVVKFFIKICVIVSEKCKNGYILFKAEKVSDRVCLV